MSIKRFGVVVATVFLLLLTSTMSVNAVTADPSQVYVTKGATNNPPMENGNIKTLSFAEGADDEFPTSGTGLLVIPAGSKIRYDTLNSTLAISAGGSSEITVSNIRFDDTNPDRVIKFDVSSTNSSATETIYISGIRFKVPVDASQIQLEFTLGTASTTVTVTPVTPSSAFDATVNLVRGKDSQAAGTTFTISANANVDGQHAVGKNITISIPTDVRDKISFDKSATVQASNAAGNALSGTITAVVTDYEITFTVDNDDFDANDQIQVSGIKFNVTGVADENVVAEFTTQLNVTFVPVNALGNVETQSTTGQIDVDAPEIGLDDGNGGDGIDLGADASLAPGLNGQEAAAVAIKDDTAGGGAIAQGTNITIIIPDGTGITFDMREAGNIEVEFYNSDADNWHTLSSVTPYFPNNRTLTFQLPSPIITGVTATDTNDMIIVGLNDGTAGNGKVNKLKFNVTSDSSAKNVNLTVITNASTYDVVQNTTRTTNVYNIDVNAPSMQTNDNADKTIPNDLDGSTGVDLHTGDVDIKLISGVNEDLADDAAPKNITIIIPASVRDVVKFDMSSNPTQNTSDSYAGTVTVTLVNEYTINVTTSGTDINANDDIIIKDVKFNITGNKEASFKLQAMVNDSGVTFESANWINVTMLTADQIQGDAQSGDGLDDFATSGTQLDEKYSEDNTVIVGSTQTAAIKVVNTTHSFNYGGVKVNLAITGKPAGTTPQLNTTTVTTDQNGVAYFNITLGTEVGWYNVTASLADNPDVNITLKWYAGPAQAKKLNVTMVENALRNTGSYSDEKYVAVVKVQVEDQYGNPTTTTGVDVSVALSGSAVLDTAVTGGLGGYAGLATEMTAAGLPSAAAITDTDSDGRFDYPGTTGDTDGDFYIFVSDTVAEEVTVTVIAEGGAIESGSATVRFYEAPASVEVTFNTSDTVLVGQVVKVFATPKTSAEEIIEVPRLSVSYDSTNTTVITSASGTWTATTNSSGVAFLNFTANNAGTATIRAVCMNKMGEKEITVVLPSLNLSLNVTQVIVGVETPVLATVTYAHNGTPVSGATVNATGCGVDVSGTTDANGQVVLLINATSSGTITVNATKTGTNMDQETIAALAPANVNIVDFTTVPETLVANESFRVNVTLNNTGDLDGTVTVTFKKDGVQFDSKVVTVPAGATAYYVESNETSFDTAGTHNITVEVDGKSKTKQVEVTALLPDLTVESINVTPESPVVNETVTVKAKIANVGDADAGAFNVSLYANDTLVETKTVESLAKGANITVEFSWTPEEAKTYELKVVADVDNAVDESNETNNEMVESVTVTEKLDILPWTTWEDDEVISDEEIQAAVYYWLTDTPVNGHIITDEEIQSLVYWWKIGYVEV